MARTVNGPSPGSERVYVPKAFDNHLDEDPVTVIIKNPTEANKRRFAMMFRPVVKLDMESVKKSKEADIKDVDVKIDLAEADEWSRAILTGCVIDVKNYTDAKGDPISNGEQLWKHGEQEFVTEIQNECTSGFSLEEEEKKTLEKSSDLPAKRAALSPGTAENAEEEGWISSGGATVSDPRLLSIQKEGNTIDAQKTG